MNDWIYNWNVGWLDWWHAHPAVWSVSVGAAIGVAVFTLYRPR